MRADTSSSKKIRGFFAKKDTRCLRIRKSAVVTGRCTRVVNGKKMGVAGREGLSAGVTEQRALATCGAWVRLRRRPVWMRRWTPTTWTGRRVW